MKSTSPRSCSLVTIGRPTARRHRLSRSPVRLPREIMSSSKPVFSVEPSECAVPSSSMRAARSFQVISSALTCIRYGEAITPAEMRVVNQKLRKAIENEGRFARIEGQWWQFSLTERTAREPSALSLLRISRGRDGALELAGRSWQEDGKLSARYWSEAVKERKEPSGIFYYWKGERPLDPNAPQLDGTGEIRMESAESASGYFTTRAATDPTVNARTAGVYWRADPEDMSILDGRDDRKRAELIAERLSHWKSIKNA